MSDEQFHPAVFCERCGTERKQWTEGNDDLIAPCSVCPPGPPESLRCPCGAAYSSMRHKPDCEWWAEQQRRAMRPKDRSLAEDPAAPHPEETCHRCGRANITWFVDSNLWNAAMRIPDDSEIGYHTREGYPDSEIVCPPCFVDAYETDNGKLFGWELRPEGVSKADDPAAVLRGVAAMGLPGWKRSDKAAMVQRVLRAAETGDGE